MKKVFAQKQKKLLVIFLAIIIFAVSIPGFVLAQNITEKNIEKKQTENVVTGSKVAPAQPSQYTQDIVIKPTDEQIRQINQKSEANRKKRLRKIDEFNYTKEDIEKLLLSGASVEDIYLSDQIGNEWLIDPEQLIKQKQHEGKSWTEIETDHKKQKEQRLKVLEGKHPNAAKKLITRQMSVAEKVEVLEVVEASGDQALNSAINILQSKGMAGLEEVK